MRRIKQLLLYQLISILCSFAVWRAAAFPAGAEVIFIANPSVIESEIARNRLKDIFLGDQVTWQNGQQITVTVNTNAAVFGQFTKKYTGRTTAQFQAYWRLILFTGKGSIPKTLNTDGDTIQYVSTTTGAIGYISSETHADGIKIIPISD